MGRSLRHLVPEKWRCSTGSITFEFSMRTAANSKARPVCALRRRLRSGGAGCGGRGLSVETDPAHRHGNPGGRQTFSLAGSPSVSPRRWARPSWWRTGPARVATWRCRQQRAGAPDGYTLVVAGQGPFAPQSAHVRQPRLQRDRRLRADHPDRARCAAARGESAGAGEFCRRADRAGEQEAGRVELRLPGTGTPPHLASELFNRSAKREGRARANTPARLRRCSTSSRAA